MDSNAILNAASRRYGAMNGSPPTDRGSQEVPYYGAGTGGDPNNMAVAAGGGNIDGPVGTSNPLLAAAARRTQFAQIPGQGVYPGGGISTPADAMPLSPWNGGTP